MSIQVLRNKPNVLDIGGVFIKPGVNELTDSQYAIVTKSREFRAEMNAGRITVRSMPKPKAMPVEVVPEPPAPEVTSEPEAKPVKAKK